MTAHRIVLASLVLSTAACSSEQSTSKATGGTAGSAGSGGTGAAAGSGGSVSGGAAGTGAAGSGGMSGADAGGAGTDGGAGADGGPASPILTPVHDRHRFDPGKMFGGWGPHLGHLVRAIASQGGGSTLWFVDDHCAQAGAGTPVCDANKNHQLGYFEYVAGSWAPRSTLPLPGTVQQNTATIAAAGGTVLHSYGVDDVSHLLRECTYSIAKGPQGCIALPFTLTANSNYVGAAVSPAGHRVVWWTNVVDGGGGGFHYIVDYGGGWNGPRSGSAAGYNDASYINIAFGGPTPNTFTMHVQFVSGFAPNWGFVGGVGSGDLSTTAPVTWSLPLAPASGDEVLSTNDIWIDPNTKDTHLMARTKSGAAVYYFRPDGGSWSPASFTLPATFRARFIVSGGRLILVYGPNAGGLAYRIAKSSDRIPKTPIDWQNVGEQKLSLPAGFGSIVAIYPESPAYQATPAQGIHAVVVGSTKESETLHVAIEPG